MRVAMMVLFLLAATQAMAGDMRCGRSILREGASQYEVISKCGDPVYRQMIQEPVMVIMNKQARIQSSDVHSSDARELSIQEQAPMFRDIERWTYNFGSGTLLRVVDFYNGEVIRITNGERVR